MVKLKVTMLLLLTALVLMSALVMGYPPKDPVMRPYPWMAFLQAHGYVLPDDVSQNAFIVALTAITGGAQVPADVDAYGFTALEAILTTVYHVNVDELGFTYSDDKLTAALVGWNAGDLAADRQRELAAAIDTSLLGAGWQGLDLHMDVDARLANYLIYKALIFTGQYRHYLGYTGDYDIFNRIHFAWHSFDQVLMPEFQVAANEMIIQGVITGYNIKRTALNARFAPDRSIVYGHSNIAHAIQLIGLLRSEGIMNAKVMLEPKTSTFLFLAEWGTPTPSPEFQVEPLEDGNYIVYAKEYDLVFEFATVDDMLGFNAIIRAYADRNERDQQGLIYGSWWVPVYSVSVPVEGYFAVKNHIAISGAFYIQSFALIEDSEEVAAAFSAAFPEAEVKVVDLWVNEDFHNFLGG